jgi:hypothetical protein
MKPLDKMIAQITPKPAAIEFAPPLKWIAGYLHWMIAILL